MRNRKSIVTFCSFIYRERESHWKADLQNFLTIREENDFCSNSVSKKERNTKEEKQMQEQRDRRETPWDPEPTSRRGAGEIRAVGPVRNTTEEAEKAKQKQAGWESG